MTAPLPTDQLRKRPNLTPAARAELRRRHAAGATCRELAAETGLHANHIARVVRGEHVSTAKPDAGPKLDAGAMRRLRAAFADGVSKAGIMERFGLHDHELRELGMDFNLQTAEEMTS